MHIAILAQIEGIAQVFHAFSPIEPGLCGCISDPAQAIQYRFACSFSHQLGQYRGLVVLAFAQPGRMQWNRDEAIERFILNPGIQERFGQPIGKGMTQPVFLLVFKPVNEFAHQIPTSKCRDCTLKMKMPLDAVRTGKGSIDGSVKWLGTGLAKRGLDPGRFLKTFDAQKSRDFNRH